MNEPLSGMLVIPDWKRVMSKDIIIKINMNVYWYWKTDIAIGSGMSCLLCLVFLIGAMHHREVLLGVVIIPLFLG